MKAVSTSISDDIDNKPEDTIPDEDDSEQTESILRCEKCGADMILRTASRGERKGQQFYGCSSFPKCKNSVSID